MSLADLERKLAALRRQAERPPAAGPAETLENMGRRYGLPEGLDRQELRARLLEVCGLCYLAVTGQAPADALIRARALAPGLPPGKLAWFDGPAGARPV